MRRFILIDPTVFNWTGHCAEYAFRVLNAAKEKNFSPVLLASSNCKISDFPDINVVAGYTCDDVLPPYLRWIYAFVHLKNKIKSFFSTKKITVEAASSNQSIKSKIKNIFCRKQAILFAKETEKMLSPLQLTQDDIIFIPNMYYSYLLGLQQMSQSFFAKAKWHVVFHYELHDLMNLAMNHELLKQESKKIFDVLSDKSIYFYTDTEKLTEHYLIFDVACKTLPIPVDNAFYTQQKKQPDEVLNIHYIGAARSNKGYHLLPDLMNQLLPNSKIKFIIQSNFNSTKGDALAFQARKKLKKYDSDAVKLLDDPLNHKEYQEHVLQSDIVLIPYEPNEYAKRSSGIFAECMAAGIPVVVPEGTWMADQLKNGTHGSKIYQNASELVTAVKEIIQHYSLFKTNALHFSKEWMAFHNPILLVEMLHERGKPNMEFNGTRFYSNASLQ